MPFITQDKTNLKYILIVIVLAVIVGGGILSYYYSWIANLDSRLAQLELRLPKTKAPEVKLPEEEVSPKEIPADETAQKQEVEQVHLKNLKYYLAGDAENFSQAFSENYIDWGSGPVDMNKELLIEMFSKEIFKQLRIKTPEEVVDLDNKIVLGYSEILESEVFKSYEDRHGFHFQEGDVFIYFPSELIPDGFPGVYRKENGIWKIIISD